VAGSRQKKWTKERKKRSMVNWNSTWSHDKGVQNSYSSKLKEFGVSPDYGEGLTDNLQRISPKAAASQDSNRGQKPSKIHERDQKKKESRKKKHKSNKGGGTLGEKTSSLRRQGGTHKGGKTQPANIQWGRKKTSLREKIHPSSAKNRHQRKELETNEGKSRLNDTGSDWEKRRRNSN